jgi:hypothetical protein
MGDLHAHAVEYVLRTEVLAQTGSRQKRHGPSIRSWRDKFTT